jgi:stage 0 sporulation protein B (sporulation initiation phosphotransferase)
MKEWDTVSLLRHARHDWLNKIQLIKGNLSLNHIDRANDIIDELVMEARHEAKLSNLRMPLLAEYLLTFNWDRHMYRLETEVIGEEEDLSSFEQPLLDFTKAFLKSLDTWISLPSDHHLLLTFQLYEEQSKIIFDFSGEIDNEIAVQTWLNQFKLHKTLVKIESYIRKDEILITLQLDSRMR